ncbi:MAG: DNA-binding response regulator [Pseudonocardiales bacterium]|nr:MAG: DNA-binding response regulator [Pseudonocardiales bacterium]
MRRVLVVEDDPAIGRAVQGELITNGHEVTWAQTGRAGVDALRDRDFDLALVDLGLPDMDGTDLCRRIRAGQPACVVVILTARDEEIDIVLGLDAGADDYLTKPFRLAELMARIRAHLRRRAVGADESAVLQVGDLEVDTAARRVRLGGREIAMRAKEFDLLARLASAAGTAVSRTQLMSDVWDENWFGSTKTLDVHLSALRRKLAEAAQEAGTTAPQIVTLRGRGYRLEDTRGPAAR